jgi:hypothetical protein
MSDDKQEPYFCSKCGRNHVKGNIYEQHKGYAQEPESKTTTRAEEVFKEQDGKKAPVYDLRGTEYDDGKEIYMPGEDLPEYPDKLKVGEATLKADKNELKAEIALKKVLEEKTEKIVKSVEGFSIGFPNEPKITEYVPPTNCFFDDGEWCRLNDTQCVKTEVCGFKPFTIAEDDKDVMLYHPDPETGKVKVVETFTKRPEWEKARLPAPEDIDLESLYQTMKETGRTFKGLITNRGYYMIIYNDDGEVLGLFDPTDSTYKANFKDLTWTHWIIDKTCPDGKREVILPFSEVDKLKYAADIARIHKKPYGYLTKLRDLRKLKKLLAGV